MRLVRISLATKYRILFGFAVLLIIAAALAVPWFYMEYLVLEPLYREAHRAADDHFKTVLGRPDGLSRFVHGDPPPATQPALGEPYFIRYTLDASDPHSVVAAGMSEDAFLIRAIRGFARDRFSDSRFALGVQGGEPVFQYARAIRVSRNCLTCHEEGQTARAYRENQLAGLITITLPAERRVRALIINRAVLIAAGALAGILAILVFYIITQRFILSPIHELRSVALRVADGDLEVRSALQTGDEFEQLSENLNTMLERLRASQEELRAANRLLDEKLGQMAETNVALYEANRVKSEFLANVSHELRTPLTSIIGFAELLREGNEGQRDERVRRYSENILISGRILLEIINDLLDLAKIEAGKVDLNLEEFDLAELCRTLVDFTRPLADKKALRTEVEADPDLPPLNTDRGKLRQILFNLLSNAIKFTPEKGRIDLVARRDGGAAVYVAVRDTGPGIPAEHQEKIFEKFRQIDQSETREQGGTGLGLAIARELTSLLGGEIGVDSEPGRGSTFWIRIPTHAQRERERPLPSLV